MKKNASTEMTSQTDPVTGNKIYVTTTARLLFRKMHPEWAKVKNDILNEAIAKAFASAKVIQTFKSKKWEEEGDIRGSDSSKFICIHRGSFLIIIAAKGSHNLPPPPARSSKASARVALEKSAEGRDDAMRAHRGWLAEHYFDFFVGHAALDAESEKSLKEYIKNNGGLKSMKGASPKELAAKAKKKPSDVASQMARTMLSEDQRGQLTREPGLLNDRPGNLSVPFSFPLE
jgi:hypothetical protein